MLELPPIAMHSSPRTARSPVQHTMQGSTHAGSRQSLEISVQCGLRRLEYMYGVTVRLLRLRESAGDSCWEGELGRLLHRRLDFLVLRSIREVPGDPLPVRVSGNPA